MRGESRAWLNRQAARVAYALLSAYLTLTLSGVIAERIPYVPPLLLALVSLTLLLAALRGLPGLASLGLILWGVATAIKGEVLVLQLLAAIALPALARYAVLPGGRGAGGDPKRLAFPLLLATALAGVTGALVGVTASKYRLAVEAVLGRAGGDLVAMYTALGQTFLFTMVTLMLALYVAYRASETLAGLALQALARPPRLFELEARSDLAGWRRELVQMRGRQYGVLHSAQVYILSALLSPLFFPVLREVIALVPGLGGRVEVVAYILASYAVSWLFSRVLLDALVTAPHIEALYRPGRPAARLLLGMSLAGVIVIVHAALGGDPLELIVAALTGRPVGSDPIGELVNIRGLEERVLLFSELIRKALDLASQFLWGG